MFEIIYSDGCVFLYKYSSEAKARQAFVNFSNRKHAQRVELFKHPYHSSIDQNALVLWYDRCGGGYWSSMAKEDPELLKKKLIKK